MQMTLINTQRDRSRCHDPGACPSCPLFDDFFYTDRAEI